jgi:hypothetical protein
VFRFEGVYRDNFALPSAIERADATVGVVKENETMQRVPS